MIDSAFGQVALILLVTVVFGLGAKLARQPLVVSYILVGILLGAILVATSGIAVTSAVSMGILLPWVAYLVVAVLFALGIRHGLRKVHRGWEAAVAAGQRWGTT